MEGRQRWHYDTLSSQRRLPSPVTISNDCGRRELLEYGHRHRFRRGRRTFHGLRAGRSSERTKPQSQWRADDTTFRERADTSVRRPGLGARLLAMSDEARAVGGWAPPPLPPGPQDLPRDYGPDGAAGGLKQEYTAPSGRHDHATTGAGRRVSPTTGTRSQITCYIRRGAGRVFHISGKGSFYLTINA